MYIDACRNLGLNQTDVFDTPDLFEAKSMSSVITEVYAKFGF